MTASTLLKLRETRQVTGTARVLEAVPGKTGVYRILIITPGMGSSGYYPREALERSVRDRIWHRGLHMHIDHPSTTEEVERPERSVLTIAAVLAEDARWDDTAGGPVAEARIFGRYRDMLNELADDIGVSIRASARVEYGDVDGRNVAIIREFTSAESIDFVTQAGRGGKVLQVIEGARPQPVREARNLLQWIESRIHRDFTVMADDMAAEGRLTREERITLSGGIGDALAAFIARVEADAPELTSRDVWDQAPSASAAESAAREATANDTRAALNRALTDEFGGEQSWLWVEDFDSDTVWYSHAWPEGSATYQLGYAINDESVVTFSGAPVEVRQETTYVPVEATEAAPVDPAGQSITESAKEADMGLIQIDEAEHKRLVEREGRVLTLETERDTAIKERDAEKARADVAEAALAERALRDSARTAAREAVKKANESLPAPVVERIVEAAVAGDIPSKDGKVDEAAFGEVVEAARVAEETYLAGLNEGTGAITGFGGGNGGSPTEVTEAALDAEIDSVFGTTTPTKEA